MLLLFVGACQDGEKKSGETVPEEVGKPAEGAAGIGLEEVEAEESAKLDFREFLVAISVQNRSGQRETYVGLGFRLNEQSEEVYVAYLREEKSQSVKVFSDGKPGLWRHFPKDWVSRKDPLLRVGRLLSKPEGVFPLLEEYAEWSAPAENRQAFFGETGDLLIETKDEEMQQIVDDEAAVLLDELKKYQSELADLLRSQKGKRDRLSSVLENRISKNQRELGLLQKRAQRLGLVPPGPKSEEAFTKNPVFVEKKVLPLSEVEAESEGELLQGVVLNGGLGLVREGRLVHQLSGKEWVEMVRAKLQGGRVWFRLKGSDWFPQVSLDWEGYAANDSLKRFMIRPIRDGKPDEGAPLDLKKAQSLSEFSLSQLLTVKERRFCLLYTSPSPRDRG